MSANFSRSGLLSALSGAVLSSVVLACSGTGLEASPYDTGMEDGPDMSREGTVAQISIERDSIASKAPTPAEAEELDALETGVAETGAAIGLDTTPDDVALDRDAAGDLPRAGSAPEPAQELTNESPVSDEQGADTRDLARADAPPEAATAEVALAPALTQAPGTQEQGAHALAHFVSVRQSRTAALEAAGLAERVPAAGQCTSDFDYSTTALTSLEPLELLEGGSVSIIPLGDNAAGGAVELAPHAFPSISTFAAGVVYTTRDRTPAALPGGIPYTVVVNSADGGDAFKLAAEAPDDLAEVTVGGVPLADVVSISQGTPLDVTWRVGSTDDLVYIDLVSDHESHPLLRCSYADETGSGSIAEEYLSDVAPGAIQFVIHRQRDLISSVDTSVEGEAGLSKDSVRAARLRFDFELSHRLELTR